MVKRSYGHPPSSNTTAPFSNRNTNDQLKAKVDKHSNSNQGEWKPCSNIILVVAISVDQIKMLYQYCSKSCLGHIIIIII